MADAQAAAVFQYLGLPVPQREIVAKVYINAKGLQPELLDTYADKLAVTVVNAAMVHGATRIELHFPGRDPVLLDTDAIKTACAAEIGHWPAYDPTQYPMATEVLNLWRLGTRAEAWHPSIAVPAQIGSEEPHVAADDVSGAEPASKED